MQKRSAYVIVGSSAYACIRDMRTCSPLIRSSVAQCNVQKAVLSRPHGDGGCTIDCRERLESLHTIGGHSLPMGMAQRDFSHWLQGFLPLSARQHPTLLSSVALTRVAFTSSQNGDTPATVMTFCETVTPPTVRVTVTLSMRGRMRLAAHVLSVRRWRGPGVTKPP